MLGRNAAVLAATLAVAVAAATAAGGAPALPKFAVTVSFTQTSTVANSWCPPPPFSLTLNAQLGSAVPITATLKGTKLTFSPDYYPATHPLQGTVSVTMPPCVGPNSSTPARTCGPATVTIHPGLHILDASQGRLSIQYGSTSKIFPDADSCSSGLIGPGATMSTPFTPTGLLRRRVTTVSGTYHGVENYGPTSLGTTQDVTDVSYSVQFTRLP
jgi:hypothetical protein